MGARRSNMNSNSNNFSRSMTQQRIPSENEPVNDYSELDNININQSTQEEEAQQFISTTAGGDGLEFDKRLGCIFDEIERIKGQDQLLDILKQQQQQQEDMGFKLEDVSDTLSPLSILLESIQSLDQLKSDLLKVQENEKEYLHILKSIKFESSISSCSQTLVLLINAYKQHAEQNDQLQSQINVLQQDKFTLQQQISTHLADKQNLQSQIQILQDEIEYYVEENKRQKQKIEVMIRQKEEQSRMQNEENTKVLLDQQTFKDKIDKYKVELYELRKQLKETLKYQELYEDLKIKDSERQSCEIQKKIQEEMRRQREIKSLMGHLKVIKNKGNQLNELQQISPFSLCTCQYLVPNDILKLIGLSRGFAQTFLKYNSRLFVRIFSNKQHELVLRIRELDQRSEMQQFIIKRNETRDQIRQTMSQDIADDKLRYIIDKHVVKPHMIQSHQLQHLNIQYYPLHAEMEKALKEITLFMADYFELVKQHQLQQQQQQEQLLRQQQLMNTSLDSSQIVQDSQKTSKISRLAGAFSLFSRKKKEQSKETNVQETNIQSTLNQISHQDQSILNANGQEMKMNSENEGRDQQEIESTQKNHKQLEDEKEQEKIKSEDHEQKSIIKSQNKELFEDDSNFNNQEQQTTDSNQERKISSIDNSNDTYNLTSQIDQPEQFLRSIDQVRSIEDMNEFLYRVGSSLVGEKQQLAQWIRGIQEGFAEFYILSRHLYAENRELLLLKDFLVLRVENLKLRVHELLNEKEDMAAIHQSDSSVKEHLIQKINELDKAGMEKSTELLFTKRKVQELTELKNDFDNQYAKQQREIEEHKVKVQREVKLLRQQVGKISDENVQYQRAIDEMKLFFNKVHSI